MKHRWGVIGFVAVMSFASGGFLLQRSVQADAASEESLFDDVMSHVNNYYVDSLGSADLYRRATEGMLDQLKDPYSVLLTGDDYRALTEQTTGNYGGLGIQIDVRDGWITVVAPLPDTPAERAGIESGDQIIQIEGESTEGWKSDQAVKALKGEPGSKVRILVRRVGVSQAMPFEIERAIIHVRSVPEGTLFDGGIGYISLTPVAETSAEELQAEIKAMQEKGMKEMILDLRRNPGGLLDQGVEVADLFLDARQEIVSTRGRARAASRTYVDQARQAWPDLPIVVLVDEFTASAAEIIAGALQDHDRAVVVGSPTFGKGLVQTLYPMAEGVALKLTTARWYTPSGRTIQREAESEEAQALQAMREGGAAVDSAVPEPDTSIKARPIFRTDAGRIVRGGGGIVPDVVIRRDTLTGAEREFVRVLGDKVPAYRDVLTSFALELKEARTLKSPAFEVSPEMLSQVRSRLRSRGVDISEDVYGGATDLVREQLGYEVARYVFGRSAEFRRQAEDDAQMQMALKLLRSAETPKDLLSLATRQATTAARASN
ncbi:MAG TPA: S41 family peptidase [Gemmatimonadales bacterium]|nr:S41 family peptidase [Gemmatimonadales bacterium]